MTQTVKINTLNRPTNETPGRSEVVNIKYGAGENGEDLTESLGFIVKPRKGSFEAVTAAGESLGNFESRSQAGHALQRMALYGDAAKRKVPGQTSAAPKTVALDRDAAAARLGISKSALSKRISRGTVETNDKGQVILPA